MLIINEDSITAIRHKLDDLEKTREVVSDVEKMLEIKEALLWRSEVIAPCCGSLCSIASRLTHEVGILEDTLAALKNGDRTRAAHLLEEFAYIVKESREREPAEPKYC